MSPLAAKPVLHGRDHCPGGADPIPCMISGPSGSFETVVLQTTDLLAYWRLGETAGPWADTSGVGTPADLVEDYTGTPPTPHVTGALPAAQDDGALEFNYDGTSTSTSAAGRFAKNVGIKDFDFSGSAAKMTVAAWVKVKASALTRRGTIIGNRTGSAVGAGYMTGWGLEVVYPARTVRFTRGQPGGTHSSPELYAETPGGVIAGEWNLFVGTYDDDTIRLYANGNLVDERVDPDAATTGPWSTGDLIRVGYGNVSDSSAGEVAGWFYGTVDEAAVWTRALNQAEINDLYNAGVEGAGAGEQVLLGDGAGGTYWGKAPPAAIEPGTDGDVLTTSGGAAVWAPGGAGGAPSADTQVWMPLTTVVSSVPELVWDAGNSLIPTLTPI